LSAGKNVRLASPAPRKKNSWVEDEEEDKKGKENKDDKEPKESKEERHKKKVALTENFPKIPRNMHLSKSNVS
jgi:hypothetical protein